MISIGVKKEEFIQNAYDIAAHNEVVFKGCSQAIVSAFQNLLGLNDILALKAATGFAGGIARQGLTCGALTGGIMILGIKYGCSNLEDYDSFKKILPFVERLCSIFKEEFGSVNCRDITGMNLMDSKQMEEFYVSGRHDRECAVVVGKTARMTAALLCEIEESLLFDISKLPK